MLISSNQTTANPCNNSSFLCSNYPLVFAKFGSSIPSQSLGLITFPSHLFKKWITIHKNLYILCLCYIKTLILTLMWYWLLNIVHLNNGGLETYWCRYVNSFSLPARVLFSQLGLASKQQPCSVFFTFNVWANRLAGVHFLLTHHCVYFKIYGGEEL